VGGGDLSKSGSVAASAGIANKRTIKTGKPARVRGIHESYVYSGVDTIQGCIKVWSSPFEHCALSTLREI
jgi:hypothetical protein